MRKTTLVQKENPYQTVRVLLHETNHGVFLFPFSSFNDGEGGQGDNWFETVEQADIAAWEDYGIGPNDWHFIDDPLPHCQQDWIAPVRVKGRETGTPQWGEIERLENGEWRAFTPNQQGL